MAMNSHQLNQSMKSATRVLLVSIIAFFIVGEKAHADTTAPKFTLDATVENVNQCASIAGYRIISTGGAITSFSISPTPTKGMIFNSTSGLLTGKPEVVAPAVQYAITGTNTAGSLTQYFTLQVTQPEAMGIYPKCQVVNGTVGVPLTPTVKYYDMFVTTEYNFSISPALPAGLRIDPLTGVITGTPTEPTPGKDIDYTVRMDEEDSPNQWFATVTLTVLASASTTTVPATTTTLAPVAKKTITCVSGMKTKRVTAINPKCPSGYKKRVK
jgi:hypothetical protein